jgi:phospholipase A-2-activating protein
VFDVEMDSGMKLKLAMDAGENPYLVADRFLADNDLPGEFKEQVRGGGKVVVVSRSTWFCRRGCKLDGREGAGPG